MTTNNILYISDGNYGTPAGHMLPLVQGQFGQSVPLEIRDLAGTVVNLTGYTFTAHKRKNMTVTAWVGAIALSGTPAAAPQVAMAVDEDDTGEDGAFSFFLEITNGTITYVTHPVSLTIARDPDVNATAAPGLVSVTTAQKALLATISGLTGLVKMAAGAASAILIKLDGTAAPGVTDDSGDGYSIGSIWVDTTNDNVYIATDVTVGAANWEQINGAGGGASDVTDLTTTTGNVAEMVNVAAAGGLQYRTVAQVLADLRDSGALATADIGTIVQGYDADLAAIAALAPANDDIVQRKAGAWTNRTIAQLTTDLGLGTLSTQSGTFSGGGTLATGGFTLTVPATGTAALLATANVFTAAQMVDGTANAIQLRVQGHSTQTSNLQTWETSAGTVVGSVSNGGNINASASMSISSSGFVGYSNNDLRIGNGSSWFTMTFFTDSAAKMRLNINGELSVGHITPAARLDTMDTTSAVTNAIVNHVIHSQRSTGTAAAGFGLAVKYQLESSTTNDTDAARKTVHWGVATHASRTVLVTQYATDFGGERTLWQGKATGTAAAIGFLGATPVVRAAHIADPTGGVVTDAEARTAINAILVVLENLGFNATS